ncbi:hypothetical protein ES332_A03G056700v1 [Gossypium tomentosum]|uniref:S-acyltransferase n=1 Tax=Gossypium tomentosum TaxID=34277 RepID=A0A5D2R2Q4_GOSTO|nr:hypothetical protein ES332_A03G056700v1 [Gossypium tomentosum]
MLAWSKSIGRCTVSFISVLLTQLALFLVPLFFSASPILIQLTLSALVLVVVLGFGGWCKRLLGFNASAPAFVFCSIFFIWGVHIAIVRQAISPVMDVLFNVEMIMLIIGLFRIMLKDPGFVSSLLQMRARYCKSCQTYVQGFDHHCPAFGNCIGQKNYVLFMVLLVGFITAEISYIVCSSQFTSKFRVLEENRVESGSILVMARSTLLFCVLQVLWQGPFLIWHVYCICFNIRTEEWVNWKNYPEFQLNASSLSGENYQETSFKNPHNKGILQNVKEFLTLK